MGIANIINNSTTTSGGEIIRELVNASDGAGLHLDGAAGGINLGSSMPDLGTKYSLEFVVKGDSKTGVIYLLDAYNSSSTNRVILAWSGSSTGNIQLRINGTWSNAFIATPDNGEVVHLLLSVDGTSATLYQNGKSVSTQTVVANTLTGATNTHIGTTQNGTGSFFNGTIYRCRFYNKTLTSAEVQTAYERADVDFADQYGSQTELITNGNFATDSNWSKESGWTISGGKAVCATSSTNAIYQTGVAVGGNKYRVTYTISDYSSGGIYLDSQGGAAVGVAGTDGTLRTADGTYTEEITIASGGNLIVFRGQASTTSDLKLDDVSVVRIGCVSDYDLAFANPTQSRTVQDRSGTADGTASTSGVTQVQPVVQLNSTSARIGTSAGTPADRELLLDKYLKFSDIYPQIVTSSTASEMTISGGNATSNGANIGLRGSTHGTPSSVRFRSGTTTTLSISSTGRVDTVADNNGDWALKSQNTHASGFGTLIIAGGSTASQTAFEVRHTGNTGSGTSALKVDGTGLCTFTGEIHSNSTSPKISMTDSNSFADANDKFIIRGGGGGNEGAGYLQWYDDSASATHDIARFDGETQLAQFYGGIAFSQTNTSATGATATGTTLGHYEEGTFTASLTFGGGDTGITYALNSNKGIYTRIGNMVYISLVVELTSKGTSTGTALINGLPFIVSDELAATSLENAFTSAFNNVGLAHAYATGTTPVINLKNSSNNSLTSSDFSNSSSIRLAGWYTTP